MDQTSYPAESQTPSYDSNRDGTEHTNACGSQIVAVMALLWIFAVTTIVQSSTWAVQQFSSKGVGGGFSDPDFLATLFQAFLLVIPLTVLALTWKAPGYRLIFRLLWFSALFNLAASLIHLPGAISAYWSIFLQIAVATLFVITFLFTQRSRTSAAFNGSPRARALTIGLGLAPLLLLPWVDAGAPGGALEFALNSVAALLFGLCAALLVNRLSVLLPAAEEPDVQRRVLVGFVAAAILTPMASSYGFGGVQLLMLIAVPATAWMAGSVIGRRHAVLALTALFGISVAGPLLFIDPREMVLSLSFGLLSTLSIAFRSAFLSALISLVGGAVLLGLRWLGRGDGKADEQHTKTSGWRWAFVAIPVWLIVGLTFFVWGSPTFHGDRLFVIMREQADVSAAAMIEDDAARRQFVYENLVQHATTTQDDLLSTLTILSIDHTPYYLVNAIEVEGGPVLRAWLESRPDVDRVLYSPILRPAEPEGGDPFDITRQETPPWNITMIGAVEVWEQLGVRGEGIVIGQSDSGVQWDHPELVDSYRGSDGDHGFNWFDPWYGSITPVDTSGHGTHTLGTVLGNNTGVAPDAIWFGCANLARNVGSPAYYLDCMQFMLAPFPAEGDPFRDGDPARGAHIINNSWGCPELEGCDASTLLGGVVALRHAGIFIVASAGNEGPGCATVGHPIAIYEQVFSVGAIDRQQNVTSFSSRGPVDVDGSNRVKPDIVAPGNDIVSAYPGDSYRSWQGTSMAGPHIAGVVALMWSANSELIGAIETTEQILRETAVPLAETSSLCGGTQQVPNNLYGYGLVDAFAAVEAAVARGRN